MTVETQRKRAALLTELKALQASGQLTKAHMDRIERESDELDRSEAFYAKYADAGDAIPDQSFRTKALGGRKWNPPSPRDLRETQLKTLFQAAKQKMPSFSVEVGGPGDDGVFFKALGEGSPGSLLPSVIRPEYTQPLPYEPDRLFEHFIGASMDSQQITYLVHTGNTQPAAVVAELGTKPDVGMQVSARTVTATKIAALASTSWEILNDFGTFSTFVPAELQRAVVDAETDFIVNDATYGILDAAGVLTRSVGAASQLDAIRYAINDLRVGPAFCKADLIVWHPSTAAYVKTQKDTLGRYLLAPDPQTGVVNSVWDCQTVENTKVPEETAIIMDSSVAVLGWTRQSLSIDMNQYSDTLWTTNAVQWRAEERIAIGIQKPKAICVLTGLGDVEPGS